MLSPLNAPYLCSLRLLAITMTMMITITWSISAGALSDRAILLLLLVPFVIRGLVATLFLLLSLSLPCGGSDAGDNNIVVARRRRVQSARHCCCCVRADLSPVARTSPRARRHGGAVPRSLRATNWRTVSRVWIIQALPLPRSRKLAKQVPSRQLPAPGSHYHIFLLFVVVLELER